MELKYLNMIISTFKNENYPFYFFNNTVIKIIHTHEKKCRVWNGSCVSSDYYVLGQSLFSSSLSV